MQLFRGLSAVRTRSVSIELVLLAVCVLTGGYLRTRGMFGTPLAFWQDEAGWAVRTLRLPLVEQLIRPIGFMFVSKALAVNLGATEVAFRLLPWAASLTGLLLTVPLARRLLPSAAGRLLFVAVIAFHPDAIDLAKEFKPYAISLALHIGMLLCAVSYLRQGSWFWLWLSVALAMVGVFFAQDVVLAYPSVYLTLGLVALRLRRMDHASVVLLAGAANAALVFAMYWFMWRHLSEGDADESVFWGLKYDVFYIPLETTGTRLAWLFEKWVGLMEFPGARHRYWPPSDQLEPNVVEGWKSLEKGVWILLHVLGFLVLLLRRRWFELVLVGLPLLVLTAFNQLGFWPFGVFRTNLFVLVYVALLPSFVFFTPTFSRPLPALAPVGLLVLAPLLTFERGWHSSKISKFTYQSYFPESLYALTELARPFRSRNVETVLFDHMGCSCWKYYARHPGHHDLLLEMKRHFKTRCVYRGGAAMVAKAIAELKHGKRVWIVTNDNRTVPPIFESIPAGYRISRQKTLSHSTVVIAIERERRK